MVAQTHCPDPRIIHRLLCGELPESDYGRLATHLELCPECRERFESEAAAPEFLGDAARLCGTVVSEGETAPLHRLMQTLPDQLSSVSDVAAIDEWSVESVRELLTPCDNPDAIGRLGDYEIFEVVGRGGMGIVLRGIDPRLNRVVAVKLLAPELASNPNARRRFFREAQAAAAVSHDHVVTIHAVNDGDRLPYLVMEYVSGESLEEHIRREGSLPVESVLRIGRQIALGLAAAHEVGLVHRDMKPANILLENGIQKVCITDFGLARAVDDVSMTRTGVVAGTPLYMSPEQADGKAVDSRSDLFSVGSILYAMCTGRPAFRAESTMAVLKRVCHDEPRPIRDVNPEVPEWLADVISRLMAKDASQRIESAARLAEILGSRLAQLQNPDTAVAPLPTAADADNNGRRKRPGWLLLSVLIMLTVFGITEAAGVTGVIEFLGIVLKLRTPEGTLVVEIEDPGVSVSVDGSEVVVDGVGIHELRLKPGKHTWTTKRNGALAKSSWVTIERGGKSVLRIHALPPEDPGEQPSAAAEGTGAVEKGKRATEARLILNPDSVAPLQGTWRDQHILDRVRADGGIHGPGGEHRLAAPPEYLRGQRTLTLQRGDGVLSCTFRQPESTSGHRVWLLVCATDWQIGNPDSGPAFDTDASLREKGWQRSVTLLSVETFGKQEQHEWSVYYRDLKDEDNFTVRTNAVRSPVLVWGSLDLGGLHVEPQWDQRVAVFDGGAALPMGNGQLLFHEVPEILKGRLYTKRNGYAGITRFTVTEDQTVFIGLYDWRHSDEGNPSGGWKEERTSPEQLQRDGWKKALDMQGWHSNETESAKTIHVYSRECRAGESFAIRNHKYQAPVVFSRLPSEQAGEPAASEFQPASSTVLDSESTLPGLIGRVSVNGDDAGTILHYRHGFFFDRSHLPKSIGEQSFTVSLSGYLSVPRDMTVRVFQAGGGVSHDVNQLFVNHRSLGKTGDNTDKHLEKDIPLAAGLHHVRWVLKGGTFRSNILAFVDAASGELLPLLNPGIASIRLRATDRYSPVEGRKLDWPVPADWLPATVQRQWSDAKDMPRPDAVSTDGNSLDTPVIQYPGANASPADPLALDRGVTPSTESAVAQVLKLGGRVTRNDDNVVTGVTLRSTSTTDADLQFLSAFPFLESLELSRTKVTDAGLTSLRHLKRLKTLMLYDTVVGDAGLEHLRGLSKLTFLVLKRTNVTESGVERLQPLMPECLISWSPR